MIKNVAIVHNQFSWIPVSGHWDDTIGATWMTGEGGCWDPDNRHPAAC
ncbi:hypothetical protein [Wolbachia endosymbiont (group A) of Campoletis raptor]